MSCPHACTDGWLIGPTGGVARCPWCKTRYPELPAPVSLYEPAARPRIAEIRRQLPERTVADDGPELGDPSPAQRAARLRRRAMRRRLGRPSGDAA